MNHQIFSFNKDPSYTIMSKVLFTKEEIKKRIENIFAQKLSVTHCQVFKWPNGLPIYNQARREKLDSLDLKNLAYFGNYTSGISLRSLIEQTI